MVTEDLKNFNSITKYFGNKVIFLKSSKRVSEIKKYGIIIQDLDIGIKLGRNILLETYLLSLCDGYIDIDTNPRQIAHGLNLNEIQKRYTIDNGFNKSWRFFNYLKYSWHIKNFLPEKLGGFSNNHNPKKNK